MKFCPSCSTTKDVGEFGKHVGRGDGLQHQCKACAKVAFVEYRAARPENTRAAVDKYRAANPDKVKVRNAKWQAANPEKRKVSSDKWHAANPEKSRAAKANWEAANPEARRTHEQNRRARKRAAGGKLSKGLSEKLFKLQRGKCACCHISIAEGNHMDHVIPLALDGPNEDWNMQLLCGPCNLSTSCNNEDFCYECSLEFYVAGSLRNVSTAVQVDARGQGRQGSAK